MKHREQLKPGQPLPASYLVFGKIKDLAEYVSDEFRHNEGSVHSLRKVIDAAPAWAVDHEHTSVVSCLGKNGKWVVVKIYSISYLGHHAPPPSPRQPRTRPTAADLLPPDFVVATD